MQPLVKQHLQSLQKTLTEVVMPKVGDDPFVAEQAGLIAASLALLAEVQPYEDDYLRAEFADLREALALLGGAPPAADPVGRDALETAVQDAKAAQSARIGELAGGNGGLLPDNIRDKLAPLVERQLEREAAWSRLTGFIPQDLADRAIGDVLASQREPA